MSAIEDRCLWRELVDDIVAFPSLSVDEAITADVCVIGGGYTGLSTALHLAEQGVSVCLLEANEIGHGGSGRNVGYVNAGMWMPPDTVESSKMLGATAGRRLNEALAAAPSVVFSLIDRWQMAAQDTRTGNLQLAHNDKTEADIRERYRQWKARGADVELLDQSACESLVGTPRVRLALLDNRSGTINPYAYAQGLAKAAQQSGAKLYEHSPISALRAVTERGSAQWQVRLANGASVVAEQVVLASNAYTEGEWSAVQQSMFIVNYYQIASEPLPGVADYILPQRQGAADTRTVLSSFRRDVVDRLLLGTVGSHHGKPAGFYPAWANRIQGYYFPELGKVNWQYQWSGQFGFTSDHLLRTFSPAPGLLAATAYNGRGITTGTVMGRAFANYLMRGDSHDLLLPLASPEQVAVRWRVARARYYETGVTLYHAGQCLRIYV